MRKVKKAIIPAAGYGTRNLPITKVLPKEMFPVNRRPAIHYIVEEAVNAGIEEVLIIVSRNKNLIIDYFDRSLELEAYLEGTNKSHLIKELSTPDIHIQYIRQPEAAGLGAAIKLGQPFVNNEPFAVLLPDELIINLEQSALSQLLHAYYTYHKSVIGIKEVNDERLNRYGIVENMKIADRHYKITNIIEKPEKKPPSNFAVIGRYIFNSTIFLYIDMVTKGIGDEIQLTDAIKEMLKVDDCYGVDIFGERYDLGIDDDYINVVQKMMQLEKKL